jgi:hypothetical protein
VRARRNFATSAVQQARKGKKKKTSGDDDDALSFLEEAARRTTSPQVVDPSASLRPNPSSESQPIAQSTKGRKRMKTTAFEDHDNVLSLLEEAVRSTTSPQVIDSSTHLRPKASLSALTSDDMQEADQVTSLLAEKAKEKRAALVSPRSKKQNLRDEDAEFLEEATKRVGLQSPEALTKPLSGPSNIARAKQSTSRPFSGRNKWGDLTAQLAETIKKLTPKPKQRIEEKSDGDDEASEQLADWHESAIDREWGHKDDTVISTPQRERELLERPMVDQNSQDANQISGRRLFEPWKIRALRLAKLEPARPIEVEPDYIPGSGQEYPGPYVSNKENKSLRESRAQYPRDVIYEEAAKQEHPYPHDLKVENEAGTITPAYERPSRGTLSRFEHHQLSALLASLRSKLQEPSWKALSGLSHRFVDTKPHLLWVSRLGQKRRALYLRSPRFRRWLRRQRSGIPSRKQSSPTERLSSSENRRASKMVQSRQPLPTTEPTDRRTGMQSPQEKSVLNDLPISPYQNLQAQARRMKEKATGHAKERLSDNPWAKLLASPIRMCQATGVRIPRDLMVGWNYVQNPKDNQVYLMPEELTEMSHLEPRVIKKAVEDDCFGKSSTSERSKPPNVPTSTDEQTEASHVAADENMAPDLRKRKAPVAPAKLWLRSSAKIIQDLSWRLLATKATDEIGQATIETRQKTHTSAVNRLIPHRWKEQAWKFEKSSEAKSSQKGFLTTAEMRNVQWHPRIEDLMMNLMRTRVLMALGKMVRRNARFDGANRRIVPLPLVEVGDFDEDRVTTTLEGFEGAVFLWFGTPPLAGHDALSLEPKGNPDAQLKHSPHSPPVHPFMSGKAYVRFVPCELSATVDERSPAASEEPNSKQVLITPVWTHNLPTNASERHPPCLSQPAQHLYLPPTISSHLPNVSPAEETSVELPVFPMPSLLGRSITRSLFSPTEESTNSDQVRAIHDAFGLGTADSCGWVLVKGNAPGMSVLMQEVWRLWGFMGGKGEMSVRSKEN